MTARGTMAHYLDALLPEISRHVDLRLIAPAHYRAPAGVQTLGFRAPDARPLRGFALADPRGASVVWDAIVGDRPDLVHIFNGVGFPWAAVVARRARRASIPVLVTVHDPRRHPGDYLSVVNAPARRLTLRAATSLHVHADIWRSVVGPARTFVVPHGSFAPRFLRRRAAGVRREPLVLFFGRIERYKGLDDLVESAVRFPFGMRTAIAGRGTPSRRARRAIAARPDLFEIHSGYQPDEAIARLLQRAAVVALPYRDASQSSVPLIAAGFGTPVAATATGALVEDVPRVGGVLARPRDPRSLSDAIVRAGGSIPTYPRELEFPALAPHFAAMYADAAT